MNSIVGMSNLLQAQFACKSANIAQNIKTHMNNEKNEIKTEIALDGHSTEAKDNRLSQIDRQNKKISSLYSDQLKEAQTQTNKQQDSSTDSVSSDGTANTDSNKDSTKLSADSTKDRTKASPDPAHSDTTQTAAANVVSQNGTVVLSDGTIKLDVRV